MVLKVKSTTDSTGVDPSIHVIAAIFVEIIGPIGVNPVESNNCIVVYVSILLPLAPFRKC